MLPLDARLAPAFRAALAGLDLERLEHDPSTIYRLFPDFTLGYFNPAYVRFAAENTGERCLLHYRIGASILPAMSEPLRRFYGEQLETVRETKQIWEHVYECPTPTLQRRYRIRVLPVGERSLLAVHSCVIETPLAETSERPTPLPSYVDEHGFVRQCGHCRRVRRVESRDWDFVPALLTTSPVPVSHGLCELCFSYYFPDEPT